MPSSQKGFAPLAILISIFLVLTVVGIYFFTQFHSFRTDNRTAVSNPASSPDIALKVTPQKTVQASTSSATQKEIFISPMGFSFKSPKNAKIEAHSTDLKSLQENPEKYYYGDFDYPTAATSEATFVKIDNFNPRIVVTKKSALGVLPSDFFSNAPFGGGLFLTFLRKDSVLLDEIKNIESGKLKAANSVKFKETGQSQIFQFTSYKNNDSKLHGVTGFALEGFSVPGLTLYKRFYLSDPLNKFMIYLDAEIECDQKNKVEKMSVKDSIQGEQYITAVKNIATDCYSSSVGKEKIDTILNSFEVD